MLHLEKKMFRIRLCINDGHETGVKSGKRGVYTCKNWSPSHILYGSDEALLRKNLIIIMSLVLRNK
jgi:hypothetical protein